MTEKTTNSTAGRIFALIMLPINTVLWGWVTSILYGWFIIPTFPSVPVLTVMQWIGIRMFVMLFTIHLPTRKDDPATSYSQSELAFISTALALICLGMGQVVHWFY